MPELIFKKILRYWDLFFLITLSFFTRFFNLSYPSKVVFDEAHFGLYATKYLSHQYFLDIHPPLGKLLLALAGYLGKMKPGFDFALGSDYGDINFLALRFVPALFGSILIILVYFFVKKLGFSRRVAFLSSFMLLFDNALIVQSRLILLDTILLFFIFLSFYLFVLTKKQTPFSFKWYLLNILCGFSIAGAISLKFTGFGILIIILLSILLEYDFFKKGALVNIKSLLIKLGFILFLPLLIYFLIFIIHFKLLYLPCSSNCGSVFEFYKLQEELRKKHPGDFSSSAASFSLLNTPPPGNIITQFFKTNKDMFSTNFDTGSSHPYQSKWYSWPFMIRPVAYFEESRGDKTSSLYFLGNPAVWWLGLLGIIGILYSMVKNFLKKFKLKLSPIFYSENTLMVICAYFVYLLSFVSIPRFMLIYHYLPALSFSVILFSLFFDEMMKMIFGPSPSDRLLFSNKNANLLFVTLLLIIFASFVYFLPLTYGIPLTEGGFQSRMWLPSWSF